MVLCSLLHVFPSGPVPLDILLVTTICFCYVIFKGSASAGMSLREDQQALKGLAQTRLSML